LYFLSLAVTSQAGLSPGALWYTRAMKAKPLSLYPLKFKEVIQDVLKVKPEAKTKPKARKSKAK
jgi:hypothetical protein